MHTQKLAWKRSRLFSVSAYFVILSQVFSGLALGQSSTSPTSPGGLLSPNYFNFNKPPAYNAMESMQLTTIMTSCQGGTQALVQNGITALGQAAGNRLSGNTGMPGGGLGMGMGGLGGSASLSCPFSVASSLNSQCPGSDQITSGMSSNLDCSSASQAQVDQLEQMLQNAMCTNMCKQALAQTIQGEIQCLIGMNTALNNKLGTLTQAFTAQYTAMQKDLTTIKASLLDHDAQIADITTYLGGDRTTGKQGLIAQRDAITGILSQMPGEIQKVRQTNLQITQMQRSLDEQNQSRTMAMTQDCFDTMKVPNYKCTPNGPPQTARDYLLCRYQQNQMLSGDKGGGYKVVEQNGAMKAAAESKMTALQSILDQIKTDTSSQSKIPTTPEEGMAATQQPLLNLTLADVANRYGGQLSGFKIGSTDAQSFVMNRLAFCNNRASVQVKQENSRASSSQGQALTQIKLLQQQGAQGIKELYMKYNQVYSSGVTSLTGNASNLDLNACEGQSNMGVHESCLASVQNRFKDLVNGTGPVPPVPINIRGNNATTVLQVSCKGINDCVGQLQSHSQRLQREKPLIENFKAQYIKAAQIGSESFLKQVALESSAASTQLNERSNALSLALGRLGQSGFSIPPLTTEKPRLDADGLPMPPDNPAQALSAYMQPPLPDLSSGTLSSALGSMSGMNSTLQASFSRISTEYNTVSNFMRGCAATMNRDTIQNLLSLQSSAASTDCSQTEMCARDKGQSVARDLNGVLARVRSSQAPGVMPGSFSSLTTGLSTFCQDKWAGASQQERNQYSSYAGGNAGACLNFYSSMMALDKTLIIPGNQNSGTGSKAGVFR